MRAGLAAVVIGLFAATAQAQEQQEDPFLELGGGAGYAQSLHGDFYFGGPAVSASARVRMSRLVAFEAQVGYWQHTSHDSFRIGTGEIVNASDTDGFTSVTASVIGHAPRRMRFAPYGGGGVGLFYRSSRREYSGSALVPPYASRSYGAGLGGQVVGGVDVHARPRLTVFGEFRFEVQSFEDPGSAGYKVLGGVRVAIG